jgi:alkylation response protein AidB-like acyl-CoA dehydrogenase
MGGDGDTIEYEMQRHFRDSRVLTVSAVSSQIQRTEIAKALGIKTVVFLNPLNY